MEIINRIRLTIGGVHYTIATPEPEEYVLGISEEINKSLEDLIEKNPSLSLNESLVLCILDAADARKKSERNADHIREQLTGYLEDAAKARSEVNELRSEVSRLKREISLAKRGDTAARQTAAIPAAGKPGDRKAPEAKLSAAPPEEVRREAPSGGTPKRTPAAPLPESDGDGGMGREDDEGLGS